MDSEPAIVLPEYQKRWVQDKARLKIGMFARQVGKTFATTLEIVDDCFQAWAEKRRARWVILSRGERQAKEAMDEGVKRHLAAYGLALEDFSESAFLCEGMSQRQGSEVRVKALEAVLPGGSRITVLPANPDTARGYAANLFLDEFALHPNSRAIWAACFPLVSRGDLKLRITSTPCGKGNKFYEIMSGRDSLWSRHTVDIHKAVKEGLVRSE